MVATVRFSDSVLAATAVATGSAFGNAAANGNVGIPHVPASSNAVSTIAVAVQREEGAVYEAVQFTFADGELADLTEAEEEDLRDAIIGQVYASAATISTADIVGAEIGTNNQGRTVVTVSFMNRQDGDTADILVKNLEELSESGRFRFPATQLLQRPS